MIEDEKSYAITERTFSKRPAAGCSIPIVSALTSYVLVWCVLECRIANLTVYVDSTEVSRIECSRNGDRKAVVYLTCYSHHDLLHSYVGVLAHYFMKHLR
jgi:hypothetical protein